MLYSSIHLKQGGGVFILEETSGGALHSSTFCCCVREIIPFHKLGKLAYNATGGAKHQLLLLSAGSAPFFHECGRHVGGVPRSSLKGKETQHDEGKRTQATPKPNKNTKQKHYQRPEAVSPI